MSLLFVNMIEEKRESEVANYYFIRSMIGISTWYKY